MYVTVATLPTIASVKVFNTYDLNWRSQVVSRGDVAVSAKECRIASWLLTTMPVDLFSLLKKSVLDGAKHNNDSGSRTESFHNQKEKNTGRSAAYTGETITRRNPEFSAVKQDFFRIFAFSRFENYFLLTRPPPPKLRPSSRVALPEIKILDSPLASGVFFLFTTLTLTLTSRNQLLARCYKFLAVSG